MALSTLVFDLDGTLLPFDHETFMKGYFRALVPVIAEYVDTEQIAHQILQSTEDMVRSEDPQQTNLEVFKRSFFAKTGIREADIWPLFDHFYEQTFAELQHLTNPTPISREICRTALDKGYRLVLATNPVFPKIAVAHRMQWAGIDEIPFALVTTMEDMHFCKPNPKYFIEILDRLNLLPFECMMFGNDVQEDGVAGKVGMETFLVKDNIIDRGLGHLEFTTEGTLSDVLTYVRDLPPLIA